MKSFALCLLFVFFPPISGQKTAVTGTVVSYKNPEQLNDKFLKLIDKTGLVRTKREAGSSATDVPTQLDDNHSYYNKSIRINHVEADFLRAEFDRIFSTNDASSHTELDNGHRIGLIHTLKFPFVFYGHTVYKIVVTTGGYLYMNEVTHAYLGFSQYVAPLMADFDTLHNTSGIRWIETEDSFWVRWDNLQLNENRSFGNFTFQCAIFKNGSIAFDYVSIPEHFHEIDNSTVYKVHIGLSDAYYYDYNVGSVIYRYIVKYHDIDVDYKHIQDDSIVRFTHLTTCNMLTTCDVCNNASSHVKSFNCSWCHSMNACSSGVDRQLQAWQNANCHNTAGGSCDYQDSERRAGVAPGIAVLLIFVVIVVLGGLIFCACVLVYGYRNPNSNVGMWMIEHRPSRMRSRMPNISFSKSGGGDIYKVEGTYDNTFA